MPEAFPRQRAAVPPGGGRGASPGHSRGRLHSSDLIFKTDAQSGQPRGGRLAEFRTLGFSQRARRRRRQRYPLERLSEGTPSSVGPNLSPPLPPRQRPLKWRRGGPQTAAGLVRLQANARRHDQSTATGSPWVPTATRPSSPSRRVVKSSLRARRQALPSPPGNPSSRSP